MQKIRQTILVEKDKHKGIVHQNNVWHGGKSIAKKSNAVSFIARYISW